VTWTKLGVAPQTRHPFLVWSPAFPKMVVFHLYPPVFSSGTCIGWSIIISTIICQSFSGNMHYLLPFVQNELGPFFDCRFFMRYGCTVLPSLTYIISCIGFTSPVPNAREGCLVVLEKFHLLCLRQYIFMPAVASSTDRDGVGPIYLVFSSRNNLANFIFISGIT
jgi:hypothetical protein